MNKSNDKETRLADGSPIRKDSRMKFWLLLVAFSAIYLLFRLPWITCDPGISSVWEYGYNATDEGYYLSGGKEKYVWDHFVDLPRNEAFTYGFSAGTHWLSYASHLAFGLSTWTWRLPFLCIYFVAWLLMFLHLAKRADAFLAFSLCTSVSLVPIVVAYERTASNDALIGSLLAISYVCAASGKRWRIVCSALVAGAIILVKPSVWALLPIVAAGVAESRRLRDSAKDLLLFTAVAVAAAFAWKLVVALSVMPDAEKAGVPIWEIVRKTTTHYPLPPLLDFMSHFKGISSFPRDPSIQLLGVAAPLILSVPFAMAARNVAAKRWNGRLLLFLAVPAYVAAISVMNTIYTHYYLPVIVVLPILSFAIASELEQYSASEERATLGKVLLPLLVTLALCAVGLIVVDSVSIPPTSSQNFYSQIYNMPSRNVWGLTWQMISVFVVAVSFVAAFLHGFRSIKTYALALIAASFVAASVVFAPVPAVQLASYIRKSPGEYFSPMAISLVISALFLVASFGFRERLPWRRIIMFAIPACILSCYLATPNWRSSFCELVRSGTHQHYAAARELSELLPKDAIVIGERSNQMLMSLPIRTATTFAANSDPIPVIESILKSEPDAKLYALADSQHAYNLQHYREHANEYRLHLIQTFKMPSFGTGAPSDVLLCRIEVLR